jgi:hypothetical protein
MVKLEVEKLTVVHVGLIAAAVALTGAVVGACGALTAAFINRGSAQAVATIQRETSLRIARDTARREFRREMMLPLLAFAKEQHDGYHRMGLLLQTGQLEKAEAFKRTFRQGDLSNFISFAGISNEVGVAGAQMTKSVDDYVKLYNEIAKIAVAGGDLSAHRQRHQATRKRVSEDYFALRRAIENYIFEEPN